MAEPYTLADLMRALRAKSGRAPDAAPKPSLGGLGGWEPYMAPMSDMTTKADLIRQMQDAQFAHEPALNGMMPNYRPGPRASNNVEVRPYGQSMPTYGPWPQSPWNRFSPSSSPSPMFPDMDFWWRQLP